MIKEYLSKTGDCIVKNTMILKLIKLIFVKKKNLDISQVKRYVCTSVMEVKKAPTLLRVTVLEAKDVLAKDFFRKSSDPFAEVEVDFHSVGKRVAL